MESGSVSRAIKLALAFGLVGAGVFFANTVRAQTIVDDWANIKVPPAPELKPVKVDAGSTALIVLGKVIVPVDGMSSINPFPELYAAFHLANAPRIGTQVTLTKFDLVGFQARKGTP